MQKRRRINPKEDAKYYIDTRKDRVGLDVKYINAFKGRGIFATTSFQKGDFLLEYRGELISKEECERRQRVYHDNLKVFMFEFVFNGKLWCVDAAKEDGSLGRLVNDGHISPNAKMKYLTVQGKPHLCLFATQEINKGEEITYNYGDSDWPWRCKVEAENAPEQMEDSISSETDPVNAVLPNNAEQDMEEKIFQSPEVTDLRSTPGNSEQVEAENAPEQMEDSISSETGPVNAVLPNNAEQDMEEKIFQSPEVTDLRSTPGNSEQVEAENAPEQMEDSISSETDPVNAVLPNNAEQDMEEKIFQSPEVTDLRSTPGNSEQVEAENAPEQMEDSISSETDPVNAVLPNNAEQDMEEKIFQSPEVTDLRSTPGNSEQVEAENAPEQMEDSISSETDAPPVLQMELIDLQCNSELKAKFREPNVARLCERKRCQTSSSKK
ncbi:uncharacterized protein V3H82_021889 [Fundulus diaphanus]